VWGSWTASQRCRAAKRASSARAQRGRTLVTGLIIVLCLAALSVIDPGAIGQEVVGRYRWRMAMDPTVLSVDQEKEKAAKPGSDFKECANGCPVMIVIPAGKFIMGSPENESDRSASEGPQHEVTVAKPFAVSKFEVTFEEWDACVAAAACPRVTDHWGRGNMPVINVSWGDAKQYVGWLSQLTGKEYRLLTEAEWEYAARAGANTRYSWGDDPRMGNANCDGCGSQWDLRQTAPVGSLSRTRWGFTTCTATSGNGLRIAGTRTTTALRRTDQPGCGTAIQASASSAAVPGATRASSSARPSASGAIPKCSSTPSASA
jgi:formylglycine-generating enzyme required for sulfatase activity